MGLAILGSVLDRGDGKTAVVTKVVTVTTTRSTTTTAAPVVQVPKPVTVAVPKPEAHISLVAGSSFCVATGIDDAYTGDGHVTFFLTFRNSGGADGSLSAVPVRHYDDGQENNSPIDEVSVDVPANTTKGFHTESFTYKAHEHEVIGCGVTVVGQSEVPIAVQ